MTLTRASLARWLQLLGLFSAAVAAVLMAVSPFCGSSLHLQFGLVAIGFDLAALAVPRRPTAIVLSLLKLTVVLVSLTVVVPCAAPRLDAPAPIIGTGAAQMILILSAVPSILGAALRRVDR